MHGPSYSINGHSFSTKLPPSWLLVIKGKRVKVRFLCGNAARPAALYNRRKWQLIGKSQWCCSTMLQLQHTPPPQSTTPGLHPVSIHQKALPMWGSKHPITAYYSVYRPQKDERLSLPSLLTCSGSFTHISGHPSAAGRVQDRESLPAKDRRSTAVPCNQCQIYTASPPKRKTLHARG